ncbi:unnamed protein product, partial [marine sediment metagenome]
KRLKVEAPSVWKYRAFMPILDESRIVSLSEGGTPLYRCNRLAKEVGVRELYVKFEGANPTGSFKDRGMTVGVTKALELGAKTVGVLRLATPQPRCRPMRPRPGYAA